MHSLYFQHCIESQLVAIKAHSAKSLSGLRSNLHSILELKEFFLRQERTINRTPHLLTFTHVFPVFVLSLFFNITRFISISPIGLTLQKIPEYLKFVLFFQAFHPLTTTGLAPLIILLLLNYKVIFKDVISFNSNFHRFILTCPRLENFSGLVVRGLKIFSWRRR